MKTAEHRVRSRWDQIWAQTPSRYLPPGIEGTVTFHAISDTESPPITADVNNDGSVNILDLVVIASDLGNAGTNLAADVSGDGVVNILGSDIGCRHV